RLARCGAALALIPCAKVNALFLRGLPVGALVIASGAEPLHSIVAHVPVLAGIKNSRMIYLATFGIAGLAGLGISKLEKETRLTQADRVLALVLVMGAFAVAFLMVYDFRLATGKRLRSTPTACISQTLL